MAETNSGNGDGRITMRQFYDAILSQNERMNNMEQRLVGKLDKLIAEGSPALVARIGKLEEEQRDTCKELEDIKKVTYTWGGVNSIAAVIAGLLGLNWRQ